MLLSVEVSLLLLTMPPRSGRRWMLFFVRGKEVSLRPPALCGGGC